MVILKMASKRKLNQSVSLAHFRFTSEKVALRAEDAAGSTVGPLPTRAEDPLPPSGSTEEQSEVTEVTLAAAMTASISDLPPGWTSKQVEEWKYRNPWLDIKAGKLGCLVCRKAKSLLLSEKGPGLHLAEEWINGDVSSSEAKRLRKKTYKHRDSQAHARSVEIAQMKEKDTLPNTFIDIQSDLLKKTTVSFRTAYTVAKERLSYKKLNPLIIMQELNGAEVGDIHKSDHACAEIINPIAKEIRRKFVCNVKEMDSPASITIDESTIHGSPYLIIYV